MEGLVCRTVFHRRYMEHQMRRLLCLYNPLIYIYISTHTRTHTHRHLWQWNLQSAAERASALSEKVHCCGAGMEQYSKLCGIGCQLE